MKNDARHTEWQPLCRRRSDSRVLASAAAAAADAVAETLTRESRVGKEGIKRLPFSLSRPLFTLSSLHFSLPLVTGARTHAVALQTQTEQETAD